MGNIPTLTQSLSLCIQLFTIQDTLIFNGVRFNCVYTEMYVPSCINSYKIMCTYRKVHKHSNHDKLWMCAQMFTLALLRMEGNDQEKQEKREKTQE